MRNTLILVAVALVTLSLTVGGWARDDEAVAKRLVNMVQGEHRHPEYYTGKHHFMNEEEFNTDKGTLEKGKYLMSWLVLDPPICVDPGMGGAASIGRDLYKEVFGIPEDEVTADPKNWPYAGLRGKAITTANKSPCCADYVQFIPINFHDIMDAGSPWLFNSGNQFDWKEWGAQSSDDFHEYMFSLVKWNQDTKVTIAVGSDDPEQTWVNGEKVCEFTGNRNWPGDSETAEFEVKGGEWVAILVEVGERGGEIGVTVKLDPPPDDCTLDTQGAMAVTPAGKLTTTWGFLKSRF